MKKELKKEIEQILTEYKENTLITNLVNKDNISLIDISINNNDELYQVYSNQNILDENIYSYINNMFHLIPRKNDIKIRFHLNNALYDNQKEKITKLFKSHYALEIVKTNKNLVRNRVIAFILLGIGALLLVAYGLFTHFNFNSVFNEIVSIFSWVFIWESCDILAFSNTSLRIENIKNIRLYKADIEFSKE